MAVYEERQISDNFIQLFERYIKIKSTHFMTINFIRKDEEEEKIYRTSTVSTYIQRQQ